jgi:DNA-binding transcriptional LysR family regulator
MNLNQIETFIKAVEQGSLSKAANKLYLSQPSVTRQIQRLEQELNCQLIDRDKGKFILTQEGKRFFRYAEYVYLESKNLFSDIARMRQGITGSLDFISTPIIGEFILPPILDQFKFNYPFVNVNITVTFIPQVIKEVTQRKDLIGFCGFLPKRDDIEAIKIGEDEVVFVTYPGHPFTLKKEITVSDIIGEPIIIRELPIGSGEITVGDYLMKIGLDLGSYQPKIVTGTTAGVLSAVEAKLGIGLISHLAITKSEAMGLVKIIKVKYFKGKRDSYCIYRKDGLTSTLSQNFIKFTQNYSREHKFSKND